MTYNSAKTSLHFYVNEFRFKMMDEQNCHRTPSGDSPHYRLYRLQHAQRVESQSYRSCRPNQCLAVAGETG